MNETQRRSEARFNERNRLMTAKGRRRAFIQTPLGQKVTVELFLEPLADFLAGRLADKPDDPPRFLWSLILQLNDPEFLALAALLPLLDAIRRGFDRDDPFAAGELKLKIGRELYDRLRHGKRLRRKRDGKWLRGKPAFGKLRWSEEDRCQAGHWLFQQATRLDLFSLDADGFPCISEEHKPDVEQLMADMIEADPVHMPHLKQPPPWAGLRLEYDDDRWSAKFVRDRRPETKAAIEAAFLDPGFEHAKGVNALKKVPLKIDAEMLALVDRFAVDVIALKKERTAKQHAADATTVAADVADAKWCGERAIWLDYNCDRRGRVYPLQNLNFTRQDHVRSLFKFHNGMKLVGGDTRWLEVHCANCQGSKGKESRAERRKWVEENRHVIQDIARDPVATFDLWKGSDSPFCYVAACRELAAAWADPENFETHLPIGFDGSANGLQHLALLISDRKVAEVVNLIQKLGNDDPNDVYKLVIEKATELLEADNHEHARWWRECFTDAQFARCCAAGQ
jgi:DNA-dependent RNA polymerase